MFDFDEITVHGMDPNKSDWDGNGIDTEEIRLGLDPNSAKLGGNGVNDYAKTYADNTDGTDADSDGDGVSDYDGIFIQFTDDTSSDSDGDGVEIHLALMIGAEPSSRDDSPVNCVGVVETELGARGGGLCKGALVSTTHRVAQGKKTTAKCV